MYHITDKGAAIMRVQRYLICALREDGFPSSPIDGVYAEDTRAAVRRFQAISGLEETGVVNEETFSLLYERYLEIESLEDTNEGVYPTEILKRGDKGEEIRRLNSYLAELFRDEGTPLLVTGEDEYSGITEESVRILQRRWNIAQTGEADRPFRRRLHEEVNARNRRMNLIYTA